MGQKPQRNFSKFPIFFKKAGSVCGGGRAGSNEEFKNHSLQEFCSPSWPGSLTEQIRCLI